METCAYNTVDCYEINNEISSNSVRKKVIWKPFLRQLLVCSGLWTTYFVTGLCMGAPTVVIPQLRRAANSSEAVSTEMASWMSCAMTYASMPWIVILPVATRLFGRKPPLLFASTTSVASFILLYVGATPLTFLLSLIILGILSGSNLTVSIILLTEYTSPQYRGMFLAIKSASFYWGIWVSNAIGTFLHWNYIGLFGLICCSYYLTFFIWPESPTYLATKGRFEECAKAHRWLKGTDERSELELRNLIASQKKLIKAKGNKDNEDLRFTEIIMLKELYKPISMSVLIMVHYHAMGKLVCVMYSIELIKKITDSESTAYGGMLILDGVSIIGMYIGCVLSKVLNRRTLLLAGSVAATFFLFLISIYLWLVHLNVIIENKIVSIALLSAYSITISFGPMILSLSIFAELLPLRFKNVSVIVVILIHFAIMGTSLKIAPWVFRTLRLYGTFGLYGTLSLILTYILYKCLPETKDKTMQDIEEYFTNEKSNETEMKLINEEPK